MSEYPTPWKVESFGMGYQIYDAEGCIVAGGLTNWIANYIVSAVNSYKEVKDADAKTN